MPAGLIMLTRLHHAPRAVYTLRHPAVVFMYRESNLVRAFQGYPHGLHGPQAVGYPKPYRLHHSLHWASWLGAHFSPSGPWASRARRAASIKAPAVIMACRCEIR